VTQSPLAPLNLGFLTVLHENNGYLGGYLVTNVWGRPLEFRLSTAVQPNRVQQILYGDTLRPYICGDLIGKSLVEKTSLPVQCVLTDCEAALDLRRRVEVPVVWLTGEGDAGTRRHGDAATRLDQGTVRWHPSHPEDKAAVGELFERLEGTLDLAEPFTRIREAIAEARKMGVTSRG
jgi:hypothetical protein